MSIFTLNASIKSADMEAIKPVLYERLDKISFEREGDEFIIHAKLKGDNSRDLNRELLSALRRVVKKTRMKSEWESKGFVERYFDYGLRGTSRK